MPRSAIAVAAFVLVALAGCAGSEPGKDVAGNSVRTESPAATVPTTEDVPTEAPVTEPAVKTFRIGQVGTVTSEGVDAGTITVQSRSARKTSKAEFDAERPENGLFVILTLTVKAVGSKTFDINPFDFYLVDPEGNRYEPGGGNSLFEPETERMIEVTTLNPGEQVKGTLIFDAPATASTLNYAPLGQAIGRWTLG